MNDAENQSVLEAARRFAAQWEKNAAAAFAEIEPKLSPMARAVHDNARSLVEPGKVTTAQKLGAMLIRANFKAARLAEAILSYERAGMDREILDDPQAGARLAFIRNEAGEAAYRVAGLAAALLPDGVSVEGGAKGLAACVDQAASASERVWGGLDDTFPGMIAGASAILAAIGEASAAVEVVVAGLVKANSTIRDQCGDADFLEDLSEAAALVFVALAVVDFALAKCFSISVADALRDGLDSGQIFTPCWRY